MRFRTRFILLLSFLCVAVDASGFEGDVHFGMTKWLALQAGFSQEQADIIARGDLRIASGDIQFESLVFSYACPGRDGLERDAQEYHYPADKSVPAQADARAVVANSAAARRAVEAMARVSPDKAGFLLLKLGQALHVLQDSWANQGTPEVPDDRNNLFACDSSRAMAHPAARGGWASHKPDLTYLWSNDSLDMAQATYDAMLHFPAMNGVARNAKSWSELARDLDGFIHASTKSQKEDWFKAHGIAEVDFLGGISLPDGKRAFRLTWSGRSLPPMHSGESSQNDVDSSLPPFFSKFFTAWASSGNLDSVAKEFGADPGSRRATPDARTAISTGQLAERLKLWRVRDHGVVADIVHKAQDLTQADIAAARRIEEQKGSMAEYASSAEAFLTLLPRTVHRSRIAPFTIIPETPSRDGNARALAAAKFLHAPYDTVGVVAEQIQGAWKVIGITAVVEH
jgi:hypothetical protein